MALRRAALSVFPVGRSVAPALFARAYAGGAMEKMPNAGPPKQSKRPAYNEGDMEHTNKWLEVREKGNHLGTVEHWES